MKTRFFILLLLQAKLLHAQSTSTEIGARAAAMGYTSSTLHDEWSLFNNVGGLGKIKQASANVAYEIKPSLTGANRMAASFIAPAKFGLIGVGVFRFGDDIYNEHLVSFGYGNQIGNTSLGAKVNYIQYRAENFGTYNAFSLDFGGITQITNQISIGAHITNLTQSKLTGTDGERLPTKLIAGIGFQPSERVFLSTEIEKDLDYQSTWKAGMEYNFYKKVFFRSGFNLNPNAAFFGVGLYKKNLKIDYAIRYNQLLVWAHQFSVSYLFGTVK